jgi:hypothetical protein
MMISLKPRVHPHRVAVGKKHHIGSGVFEEIEHRHAIGDSRRVIGNQQECALFRDPFLATRPYIKLAACR